MEDNAKEQAIGDGIVEVGGRKYMTDPKGALVPLSTIKETDKLIDQTVRKMMGFADALSSEIARFKGHCFDDVGALQALVAEKYGSKVGGAKGNVTLTSFDGCFKVTIQVQDQLTFGPELQAAKCLVDECIEGWSEGARDEIRALVNHAFQVDKEGRINRAALFQLRRVQIEDERWQSAMEAITDSMRVIGSATYMRFHRRDNPQERWAPVTIDMAAA
ncbi:DUF3164 family protein [Breoghania sp.]|uniref:DUF3164 family protein n=1 Tax=Breoghania sp. TaxID=2065378 RepID=UPI0029CA4922|nr:DUF3164 family protein [Breoghania sp.]